MLDNTESQNFYISLKQHTHIEREGALEIIERLGYQQFIQLKQTACRFLILKRLFTEAYGGKEIK